MHFLQVNILVYEAVDMIHDVITHFHILLNLCSSALEMIEVNKSDVER